MARTVNPPTHTLCDHDCNHRFTPSQHLANMDSCDKCGHVRSRGRWR